MKFKMSIILMVLFLSSALFSFHTVSTVYAKSETITQIERDLPENENYLDLTFKYLEATNSFLLKQTIIYNGNQPLIFIKNNINNIILYNEKGNAIIAKEFNYKKAILSTENQEKKHILEFTIPDGTYKVHLNLSHKIKREGLAFTDRGDQTFFMKINKGEVSIVNLSNEQFFKGISESLKNAGVDEANDYQMNFIDGLDSNKKLQTISILYKLQMDFNIEKGSSLPIVLTKNNKGMIVQLAGKKVKKQYDLTYSNEEWQLKYTRLNK